MNRLFILKYNNYYNRKLKREDSLDDYLEHVCYQGPARGEFLIDFKPNDQIDTVQKINWSGENPDYLLVCSPDTNDIESRWFIIESRRIRGGQHELTLRRDVFADFWEYITNADCFIEKAILPDTNPLIFNQEAITTNQIKDPNYELIKDDYGCGWIIGYMARTNEEGQTDPGRTINFTANIIADEEVAGIANWRYNDYRGVHRYSKFNNYSFWYSYSVTNYGYTNSYPERAYLTTETGHGIDTNIWKSAYDYNLSHGYIVANVDSTSEANAIFQDKIPVSYIEDNLGSTITDPYYSYWGMYVTLLNQEGKIIKDTVTNKYYKVSISTSFSDQTYNADNTLKTAIVNKLQSTGKFSNLNLLDFDVEVKFYYLTLTLTEVTSGSFTVDIPAEGNREHLKDAPWDLFCIPFEDNLQIESTGTATFNAVTVNRELAISIAQGMAAGLTGWLLDLQIVPYSCMTGFIRTNDVLDIKAQNANRYTMVRSNTNQNVLPMIWATASSGTKMIALSTPKTVDNVKMQNQTEFYRLVSPNYNGQFEFNLAKNDGLEGYTVDYTYLPHRPYIRVAPIFNGLYGQPAEKEARGLICGGDFSIGYMNDQWANYQTNNKNYLNIFNRQIENMEVKYKWQMAEATVNAIAGTAMGAAQGSVGGPWGAVAGGVAGAIGGVLDVVETKALQNEALDFTKDNFRFNLENIQALPQSIANVGAFLSNNTVFPFLERYDCTETEKRAVANKIAFNGMTVGVIGKFSDYLENDWSYDDITDKGYIKGQLIRLEGLDDDYHVINAISGELNKGVYTK